jgi:hypothetical protein
MSERNKVVPDAMLSKEFLSQFKTEADVSKFLKQLHSLPIALKRYHRSVVSGTIIALRAVPPVSL